MLMAVFAVVVIAASVVFAIVSSGKRWFFLNLALLESHTEEITNMTTVSTPDSALNPSYVYFPNDNESLREFAIFL